MQFVDLIKGGGVVIMASSIPGLNQFVDFPPPLPKKKLFDEIESKLESWMKIYGLLVSCLWKYKGKDTNATQITGGKKKTLMHRIIEGIFIYRM